MLKASQGLGMLLFQRSSVKKESILGTYKLFLELRWDPAPQMSPLALSSGKTHSPEKTSLTPQPSLKRIALSSHHKITSHHMDFHWYILGSSQILTAWDAQGTPCTEIWRWWILRTGEQFKVKARQYISPVVFNIIMSFIITEIAWRCVMNSTCINNTMIFIGCINF